jgi:hypothetical protein
MNPEQNGGQLPPQYPPQPQPPMQSPTPPPTGGDPYEFIMNPAKPPKRPIIPVKGGSLVRRIAVVGGGLVLLIIVGVVFAAILGSSGKEKTESLLTIAQDQTELIRVSTEASSHTTSLSAQNLAQGVQAAVTSDRGELLAYMNKNGQKPKPAQLAEKHSKTTDTTLQTALENNTYDIAFKDIVQSDLDAYMTALKKAYDANPGPNGKKLLSKQYDSAVLLLKVSKQ